MRKTERWGRKEGKKETHTPLGLKFTVSLFREVYDTSYICYTKGY